MIGLEGLSGAAEMKTRNASLSLPRFNFYFTLHHVPCQQGAVIVLSWQALRSRHLLVLSE